MWFASLISSSLAIAGVVCPPSTRAIRDFESLRQDVFFSGSSDPRRTLEKFAEEEQEPVERVYEKYAFAGQLVCGGYSGSVNLTVKGDVITTAAHCFYDENGRRRGRPGSKCVARFKKGPNETIDEYEIDESTLKVGRTKRSAGPQTQDWAVVKLKKLVSGIEPIKIPQADKEGISKGQIVLAVSGPQTDHTEGKDMLSAPNLIHRCVTKTIVADRSARTTCALGGGGSGSAMIQENGMNPFLLGIGVNSTGDKASGREYDADLASSTYIPLEGDFLNAVRAASNLSISK